MLRNLLLEKRISSAAFDKFGVVGKHDQNEQCCSPANSQPNISTQMLVPWFITHIMFQLISIRPLSLKKLNPAKCSLNVG